MAKLIAFDTETWLSTPGHYVPRGVCASFADHSTAWNEGINAKLEGKATGLDTYASNLNPDTVIAGAHSAYDNAVACAERPELLPRVFEHYDRMGFFDVLIAQALDHVSRGHIFTAPDGGPMRLPANVAHPNGQVKKRYGLELVTWQNLQRPAKENDLYRKRYGELEPVPMENWPEQAIQYPKDDARNTWDNAAFQIQNFQNLGPLIRVIPSKPPEQWEGVTVKWEGSEKEILLTHMGLNAYAGWCLHLLSAWGLRVGVEPLKRLITRVEAVHEKEIARFVQTGLLKPDGKDNGIEIKRRIIRAYNPGREDVPCSECGGSGKALGKPNAKGERNPVQCKPCSATGLNPGDAPLTKGGESGIQGVCADRDACTQSGDQDLSDLRASTNRKLRDTFIPFLVDGIVYPINVQSNVLVATARTSFGKQEDGDDSAPGLLQTFPRKGGARECIIAPDDRPSLGFEWVMCSNDWNALEFANLGQAQLWVCGRSPIVDAINAGKDPHVILGARMLGITYEQFMAGLKDPSTKAFYVMIRQGTKAGNFGFGGRMGAPKFALTQRRAKIGGHGSMCRLMGRESPQGCGKEKISTWWKRPIDPICLQCVEVSDELKKGWLETWELEDYFAYVDALDGIQDGEAVMITPGTGYMRGGLNVSEACNQPFQHLGGYGSKLALCMVSRECYVDRGTALFGCRPIIHAHDEIITLMPRPTAHLAAARQTVLMKKAMGIICPDVAIGIAPALMRAWYKEAEEFYLDPNCKPCGGQGWIPFTGEDGKPNRKQCPECKRNGILSPWEPMPEAA
jgi:hypothetical protein